MSLSAGNHNFKVPDKLVVCKSMKHTKRANLLYKGLPCYHGSFEMKTSAVSEEVTVCNLIVQMELDLLIQHFHVQIAAGLKTSQLGNSI